MRWIHGPGRWQEGWILFGIMVAAVLFWVWFRLFTGICLEDALITYRYAQNLATGHGFVFNQGERVLGTTTPLLTLLLAAIGSAVGVNKIPLASCVLMMVAGLAAGLFAYATMRTLGWSRLVSGAVLVLLYFHPVMVWVVTGGMETPLVVCLMFLSLYAMVSGRLTLLAFAASLLILTRVDGAIWAGLICGGAILRTRKLPLLPSLIGVMLLLSWFSFSLAYFNSIVPHSVAAKHVIQPERFSSPVAMLAAYGQWLMQSIGMPEEVEVQHLGGCVWAAFGCFGVLAIARDRARRPLWVIPLFILLYWASFILGNAPLGFPWYRVPITACSLVLGAAGAAEFALALEAYRERYSLHRRAAALSMSVLLALCGVTFVYLNYAGAIYEGRYQANEDGLRRTVGEWLRDHTDLGAVIAMEAIGYQGYYSGRRVIDLAGLVSPNVVQIKQSSRTNAESFSRILRELRPDYLVLRSFEVDTNLHYHGGVLFSGEAARQYFDSHYQEVRRFAAPFPEIWGDRSYLTVYRRVVSGGTNG